MTENILLEKVCRICLYSPKDLVDMKNVFSNHRPIIEAINNIFGHKCLLDKHIKLICTQCTYELTQADKFKRKCKYSFNRVHRMLTTLPQIVMEDGYCEIVEPPPPSVVDLTTKADPETMEETTEEESKRDALSQASTQPKVLECIVLDDSPDTEPVSTTPKLSTADLEAVDPLKDFAVDPLMDTAVDPLADTIVDPITDTAVDPLTDSTVAPLTAAAVASVDPLQDIINEHIDNILNEVCGKVLLDPPDMAAPVITTNAANTVMKTMLHDNCCKICHKWLKTERRLTFHMHKVHKVVPFPSDCNKKRPSSSSVDFSPVTRGNVTDPTLAVQIMDTNLDSSIENQQSDVYQCHICGTQLKTEFNLQRHIDRHLEMKKKRKASPEPLPLTTKIKIVEVRSGKEVDKSSLQTTCKVKVEEVCNEIVDPLILPNSFQEEKKYQKIAIKPIYCNQLQIVEISQRTDLVELEKIPSEPPQEIKLKEEVDKVESDICHEIELVEVPTDIYCNGNGEETSNHTLQEECELEVRDPLE